MREQPNPGGRHDPTTPPPHHPTTSPPHHPTTSIFLIGYRAPGKTTVARLLAGRLGWDWVDADQLLEERHARTIRQIFAEEGEPGFREKEAALVEELCGRRRHVVAMGGGVVLRPENRARLR